LPLIGVDLKDRQQKKKGVQIHMSGSETDVREVWERHSTRAKKGDTQGRETNKGWERSSQKGLGRNHLKGEEKGRSTGNPHIEVERRTIRRKTPSS